MRMRTLYVYWLILVWAASGMRWRPVHSGSFQFQWHVQAAHLLCGNDRFFLDERLKRLIYTRWLATGHTLVACADGGTF